MGPVPQECDVFLSYAREDRARAKEVAEALGARGWRLYWDLELFPGERFGEVIEERIARSKCVVVLWSATSTKSDWVKGEADEGRQNNKLVPATVDAHVRPPIQFRELHTASLAGWSRGVEGHEGFADLVRGIERLAGLPPKRGVENAALSDVMETSAGALTPVVTEKLPAVLSPPSYAEESAAEPRVSDDSDSGCAAQPHPESSPRLEEPDPIEEPLIQALRPRLRWVSVLGGAVALLGLVLLGIHWLYGGDAAGSEDVKGTPSEESRTATTRAVEERSRLAEKLSKARTVVGALGFAEGTRILQGCTLADGTLAPEAQDLLAQLEVERNNRTALQEASRLLAAGHESEAKAQLDIAAQTKLLRVRYEELLSQVSARADARSKGAPTALGVAQGSDAEEGRSLALAASQYMREEKFSAAAVVLERCLKRVPAYYRCHKLYGSVEAQLAVRDNSEVALDKARSAYERFIELAPPGDPDIPRVRGILEAYRQGH